MKIILHVIHMVNHNKLGLLTDEENENMKLCDSATWKTQSIHFSNIFILSPFINFS